jgi:hypothetical protein
MLGLHKEEKQRDCFEEGNSRCIFLPEFWRPCEVLSGEKRSGGLVILFLSTPDKGPRVGRRREAHNPTLRRVTPVRTEINYSYN